MLGIRSSAIDGVERYQVRSHTDERGDIVEMFHALGVPHFEPAQWNVMRSIGNVLRGFRCHVRHTDLLMVASGTMLLGLADLRPGSPSEHVSEMVELKPAGEVVSIPPGVGHGLYFPEPAILVQAVTHTWSIDDEFGCRWDDPDLGLDWKCVDPVVSEADRNAQTFAELREVIRVRIAA